MTSRAIASTCDPVTYLSCDGWFSVPSHEKAIRVHNAGQIAAISISFFILFQFDVIPIHVLLATSGAVTVGSFIESPFAPAVPELGR
jgi:hypothetical protein